MQRLHIPAAAGAVHLLCRVEARPPGLTCTTRPLSDVRYGAEANAGLVRRFAEGMGARARAARGGGPDDVVRDLVPYGLSLLGAGGALSSPVSSVETLDGAGREAFAGHVASLRSLGLTYVRDGGREGGDAPAPHRRGGAVRLEPEIDRLVRFADLGDGGGGGIPDLTKELLAHGADVAAIREREEAARAGRGDAPPPSAGKSAGKPRGTDKVSGGDGPDAAASAGVGRTAPKAGGTRDRVPPAKAGGGNSSAAKNFLGLRAARAKEARTARRAARVGFERKDRRTVRLSNTGSGEELARVIRFKYQKGFTQAVRAPCELEDLL